MRRAVSILAALGLLLPCADGLAATLLFADRVVAKGRGLEIKYSQVEEAFITYKANKSAAGEPTPRGAEEERQVEKDLLDRLIATKLFQARATAADRTNATATAEKFIEDQRDRATSEAAFLRQLRATGLTLEQFREQLLEQAVAKAVIDREIKTKQKVTDEQIQNYYDGNPALFEDPERWRVSHIHFSLRDRATRLELDEKERALKHTKAEKTLDRAKAGEDFAALARENSEDLLSRDRGGEYTFVRGQMPPEFEAAAIALQPNQLSALVLSRFGWHIIKLHERLPAGKAPLPAVREKIHEAILHESTQKLVPAFIDELRKVAGVETAL